MHKVDQQPKKYSIVHSANGTPLASLLFFSLLTLIGKIVITVPFAILLYYCSGFFLEQALSLKDVLNLANGMVLVLFFYELIFIAMNERLKNILQKKNVSDSIDMIHSFGYQIGYTYDAPIQVSNLDDPSMNPSLTVAYQALKNANHRFVLMDHTDNVVGGVRILGLDGELGELKPLALTDPYTQNLLQQIRQIQSTFEKNEDVVQPAAVLRPEQSESQA